MLLAFWLGSSLYTGALLCSKDHPFKATCTVFPLLCTHVHETATGCAGWHAGINRVNEWLRLCFSCTLYSSCNLPVVNSASLGQLSTADVSAKVDVALRTDARDKGDHMSDVNPCCEATPPVTCVLSSTVESQACGSCWCTAGGEPGSVSRFSAALSPGCSKGSPQGSRVC
jgi:hypothetical protein